MTAPLVINQAIEEQKATLRRAHALRWIFADRVMPNVRPRIAVVIPAFNEEKNILHVLREIQELRATRPEWEILPIVINDGSSDRTAVVLDEACADLQAQAVNLPINLGIGRAVQTGFKLAVRWGADVTLQLDGDGQHPPSQIPIIVGPVLAGTSDVVVGSRYVKGAGGNVSSGLRQAGTWFFSKLLRALVGVKIEDTTSGFRAFSYDAADFISRYYPDDYPEVQAYVPLARKKFRIDEVGVEMRHRERGRSSITPIRSIYYMVKVAFATMIDKYRPLPKRRGGGGKEF